MKSEPCIWVYISKIGVEFNWRTWESTPFTQCGIRVTQNEGYGFTLSQQDFVNTLHPVHLNKERFRERNERTTEKEHSQMRAVLGSLSWRCGQTNVIHSSDVNIIISLVPESKIEDVIKLNKLVDEVKRNYIPLKIHAMAKDAPVELVAWGGAAWANRPDGINSTEGIVVGLASQALRKGSLTEVTLLA